MTWVWWGFLKSNRFDSGWTGPAEAMMYKPDLAFQSKWCHLAADALSTGVYHPGLSVYCASLMDIARSDGKNG